MSYHASTPRPAEENQDLGGGNAQRWLTMPFAQTAMGEFAASGATETDFAGMANAMTVDVEDYFQVSAFADRIDRDDWDRIPCRVEANVDAILALFDT